MRSVVALYVGLWASLQGPPPGQVSLWDLERFPPPSIATEWYIFTQQHVCWCEYELRYRSEFDWLHYHLGDARERHAAWELLKEAHDAEQPAPNRRNTLRRLRTLIGQDAYDAGRMPEPAAWWRFTSMDR